MANVIEGSGENLPVADDFKMPSTEELLAAIETMGLSEDQKKELLESLVNQEGGGFPGFGEASPPLDLAAKSGTVDVLWVLILFSLVFLVLVFFGYKLYKSLVDRERRKEEKKRQKLQKKKK